MFPRGPAVPPQQRDREAAPPHPLDRLARPRVSRGRPPRGSLPAVTDHAGARLGVRSSRRILEQRVAAFLAGTSGFDGRARGDLDASCAADGCQPTAVPCAARASSDPTLWPERRKNSVGPAVVWYPRQSLARQRVPRLCCSSLNLFNTFFFRYVT